MAFVPLHRAKFDLGSGAWVDIECALGRGTPTFEPTVPKLLAAEKELDADILASGGIAPMCWREAGALFEKFQLREDTDYFVDVSVPIPLAQAIDESAAHVAWPFDQRLALAFKRDPSRRWKEVVRDDGFATVLTGQLRLRSQAGVLSFKTRFGPGLMAEVACRKLKYFEEFQALLDSLAEKAAELLLAFDSPVSLSFTTSGVQAQSEAALHFIMRHVMSAANLPAAIEQIARDPHSRLVEQVDNVAIEEIEDAEPDLIADGVDASMMSPGGPLSRLFGGFTPRSLPRSETIDSNDTPENRYALALLHHCLEIARGLHSRLGRRRKRAAQREARDWTLMLERELQGPFWTGVGRGQLTPGNSQTLLRKRGYKDLLRCDLALRMSLSLDWPEGERVAEGLDELAGDIRPVNQIYEYWCFFVLREIIQSVCREVSGGNFILVSSDNLAVSLRKGETSECRFEYLASSGTKVLVKLFYNRKFVRPAEAQTEWDGSYTASFDPDYSVFAQAEGAVSPSHWLHFDAKYRLERRQAEQIFESAPLPAAAAPVSEPNPESEYQREQTRVHKQDDLYKMHTYRDGILGTRGAYILFPGDGAGGRVSEPRPNLFVRHPSAIGGAGVHRLPSVGSFDLAPGGDSAQREAIKTLLLAAFEVAAAGVRYQEEDGLFASD